MSPWQKPLRFAQRCDVYKDAYATISITAVHAANQSSEYTESQTSREEPPR